MHPFGRTLFMQTNAVHDLFNKCYEKQGLFKEIRETDEHYFAQPVLEGPLGPHMMFSGRRMIVWSINDYLGLACHPEPRRAAEKALLEYGTAYPMGARLMSGYTKNHAAFERKLADFSQKESALLFNYGYLGILGIITSLIGPKDTVIIDHDAHACIVDGAKLATTKRHQFRIFRHNDLAHLEKILQSVNQNREGGILIVTDGVYGMSGELAPLRELCDLKDKYGAKLLVDDAHGIGIMGSSGRGTGEHCGVQDRIDLYFATFAKCFAGIGAFVAGPREVIEHINWNARPLIFAKNLPLIYVEALSATLDVMQKEPGRRKTLWHISDTLQKTLVSEDFHIGNTGSPITPVYMKLNGIEETKNFIYRLREEYHVFASGVMYPVVPPGILLLRLVPTALHSPEDIKDTIDALIAIRKG